MGPGLVCDRIMFLHRSEEVALQALHEGAFAHSSSVWNRVSVVHN